MELEPGELICPKCNGTGESTTHQQCEKCWGLGKLDWVENVVGKKPAFESDSWTIEYDMDINSYYPEMIFKDLGKHLAKEIDKQIINKYLYGDFSND